MKITDRPLASSFGSDSWLIVSDVDGIEKRATPAQVAAVIDTTGASSWGAIAGTLADQTDLQTALNAKAASSHTHAISDVTSLQTSLDGKAATGHNHDASYAALSHTHASTDISDSTVTGRALITATDAAAGRTAIGAGTSSFDGVYTSLTSIPSTFAPSAHTHPSTDISDSTVTGRAVIVAANAAAGRTAIGAGTSNFSGAYADLTGKPTLGNSAALDVGTIAGTVSAGDHTHPGGSEAFPVGSIYLAVVSTNPGTLLGYGTWSAIGAGRVLVGLDSGDTAFDTVEETGGAKTVASAGSNSAPTFTGTPFSDIINHTHPVTDPGHTHVENNNSATTGGLAGWAARDTSTNTPVATGYSTASSTTGVTTENPVGGVASITPAGTVSAPTFTGSATSVVQPYFVCYMWRRDS